MDGLLRAGHTAFLGANKKIVRVRWGAKLLTRKEGGVGVIPGGFQPDD